jgi:3' terminal RNA ribose 2'-O-methyltransferase Hen1
MLIRLRTTRVPATDLGYLLHKHPDKAQTFSVGFGSLHVLWPEAGPEAATCALLLELDPISLVRGGPAGGPDGPLAAYVNDRPYVASSFLTVAMNRVLRSAVAGRCELRPDLVDAALPLEVTIDVLRCRGGERFARAVLEPLGWQVSLEFLPLDEGHPGWGPSNLARARLSATMPVRDALRQLVVLLPVIDGERHTYIDEADVEQLLARGEGWLEAHPMREAIATRFLRHRRNLTRAALARLAPEVEEEQEEAATTAEGSLEAGLSLAAQRVQAVMLDLVGAGAVSVADLGCGEGRLLRALVDHPAMKRVVGMDVSAVALERAERRLLRDDKPKRAAKLQLIQGSLQLRDSRLRGLDAALLIEVIEHLDEERLPLLEDALFGDARPKLVIVTTPNVEYNVLFPTLPAGKLRHGDHRFEWTRAELQAWAEGVAARRGYAVSFSGIGPEDPERGAPTQVARFVRLVEAA